MEVVSDVGRLTHPRRPKPPEAKCAPGGGSRRSAHHEGLRQGTGKQNVAKLADTQRDDSRHLSIYDGQHRLGHIAEATAIWWAFDQNGQPIGPYRGRIEAARAVSRAADLGERW